MRDDYANIAYRTRVSKIPGRSDKSVVRVARAAYNRIAHRTKRNPYVRSAYFDGDKVFLRVFWEHLNQKPQSERKRRLKFYLCAIELLENTTLVSEINQNPNKRNEVFYRFVGEAPHGEYFFVQVKEELRTGNKYFMSVFPAR